MSEFAPPMSKRTGRPGRFVPFIFGCPRDFTVTVTSTKTPCASPVQPHHVQSRNSSVNFTWPLNTRCVSPFSVTSPSSLMMYTTNFTFELSPFSDESNEMYFAVTLLYGSRPSSILLNAKSCDANVLNECFVLPFLPTWRPFASRSISSSRNISIGVDLLLSFASRQSSILPDFPSRRTWMSPSLNSLLTAAAAAMTYKVTRDDKSAVTPSIVTTELR